MSDIDLEPLVTRAPRWKVALLLAAFGFFATVLFGNIALPLRVKHALIAYGAGAAVGVVAVIVGVMRTRGRGVGELAGYGALLFFGAMLLTGSSLFAVNKFADSSAGTDGTATVVSTSKSKNGVYAHVRGLLEPDETLELHVAQRDKWQAMKPGDVVHAKTHPGAFGWPWAEPIR